MPPRLLSFLFVLMLASSASAQKEGPWQDLPPCPDLDCSGGCWIVDGGTCGSAPGMYYCAVRGSTGGRCLSCVESDANPGNSFCGRVQTWGVCKCEATYVNGKRGCKTEGLCEYKP